MAKKIKTLGQKKLKKLLTSDFVCDKINKSSKDDTKYADVAELADALDLGSSEAIRECSSHFIRTNFYKLVVFAMSL